ncbi:extracellular solute-binding protein [Paenibacillus humicola]|uniref:extracellular solute-binding protein n=1 Tax=Paenibacillus humicola TaxID=3110540 RepID=UPI00237ADADD|nr:extracellular solute-binding protein [Paenibacillus humicola]
MRKRLGAKSCSLMVALMLTASVGLAGCSGGAGKSGDDAGSAGGNASSGRKTVEITVMRGEHPAQPLVQDSPVMKEIEKQTGVKIDLQSVPGSDYDAKKKTLITTNNIPDVLSVSRTDLENFAKTGIFLDVTKYLDQMPNFKKRLEEQPETQKLMMDGKLYGFPTLAQNQFNLGQLPMIRTDVLKKLNLNIPTTFDELYDVLKKMKAAYPDSYPWTMRNGTDSNLSFLEYAFGSGHTIYYEPDQKKYLYGPAHPEYKAALEYLHKLYADKLLDPNFTNATLQQWQENLSSGKSLFFYDNYSFTVNFNNVLQQKDPNQKFDMVPVLTAPDGKKRSYAYIYGHPEDMFAVSAKVKNPEAVMKLFDWMYSDEGARVTNFGIEGTHYTTKDGKPVINPSVIDQFKDKQDPFRAMQSALGTGLLTFDVYTNDDPQLAVSPPDLKRWSDFVGQEMKEGLIQAQVLEPSFTDEERDQLKQLRTKVDTIVEQNIDKFVLGTRPLTEFDAFMKEVKAAGAEDIEKIYNDALARTSN